MIEIMLWYFITIEPATISTISQKLHLVKLKISEVSNYWQNYSQYTSLYFSSVVLFREVDKIKTFMFKYERNIGVITAFMMTHVVVII